MPPAPFCHRAFVHVSSALCPLPPRPSPPFAIWLILFSLQSSAQSRPLSHRHCPSLGHSSHTTLMVPVSLLHSSFHSCKFTLTYALVFNKYLLNQHINESLSPEMAERPSLATQSYFSLVVPSSQHENLLACLFTHRESSFTAQPSSPILSSMTSSTVSHSSQNLFLSL